MKSDLALTQPEAHSMNPLEMVQAAIERQIDPAALKQIMDLAERWEANQARKAFYAAMKKFKDNPPEIRKNGTGHNNAKYATLDHACDQIIPALASVGITHKWRVSIVESKISVTCVLTHELGFSDPEPPTIEAMADKSGGKNDIQAIGSAIKYLERYTLFAATGLDDGSKDDDGAAGAVKDGDEWIMAMEGAGTREEILRVYGEAYKGACKVGELDRAKAYIAFKDKRIKEMK
jgi:hypothetical protein